MRWWQRPRECVTLQISPFLEVKRVWGWKRDVVFSVWNVQVYKGILLFNTCGFEAFTSWLTKQQRSFHKHTIHSYYTHTVHKKNTNMRTSVWMEHWCSFSKVGLFNDSDWAFVVVCFSSEDIWVIQILIHIIHNVCLLYMLYSIVCTKQYTSTVCWWHLMSFSFDLLQCIMGMSHHHTHTCELTDTQENCSVLDLCVSVCLFTKSVC